MEENIEPLLREALIKARARKRVGIMTSYAATEETAEMIRTRGSPRRLDFFSTTPSVVGNFKKSVRG